MLFKRIAWKISSATFAIMLGLGGASGMVAPASAASSACLDIAGNVVTGATLISETDSERICQVVVETAGESTFTLPAGISKYSMWLVGAGGGSSQFNDGGVWDSESTPNRYVYPLYSLLKWGGGAGGEVVLQGGVLGTPTSSTNVMTLIVGAGGASGQVSEPENPIPGSDGSATSVTFGSDLGLDSATARGGAGAPGNTSSGGYGIFNKNPNKDSEPGGGTDSEEIPEKDLTGANTGLWETALPNYPNVAKGGWGGDENTSPVVSPSGKGSGGNGAVQIGDSWVIGEIDYGIIYGAGSGQPGVFVMRFAIDLTYVPGNAAGDNGGSSNSETQVLAQTGDTALSGLGWVSLLSALAGVGLFTVSHQRRRSSANSANSSPLHQDQMSSPN